MMNRVRQFFYGRRGMDQLNMAMLAMCCIFSLLAQILRVPVLSIGYWVLFAAVLYRMLSKDLYRRGQENMRFMGFWQKLSSAFSLRVRMVREWRTHRYLKCPSCKQRLRVPKGKGKIKVTCAKCHTRFEKKV